MYCMYNYFSFFTDIENNLTRIAKLIKNEEQSKKDGNSRKEKELVGLIEDFYNQYQSLYALCGRLTGEYVKASPGRLERVSSVSSSSSESEYFSSEEVDGYTDFNDSNQRLFLRERERSTLTNNTREVVLKTQASNEAKELEKLIIQTKELGSLNRQKRNLELQVERQVREIKQLGAKNSELQARVLELELLLKESKGTVSALQAKLKSNEDQATSKIAELMARINKLEQEAKSLRTQKGKMEEKTRRNRNETLCEKKDFTDQLSVVQQNLDSANKKNKALETQLEREREKVSQYMVRIENLEENLAKTTSSEKSLLVERERFLARIKGLELEVESRCSQQNDLEEHLRNTRSVINRAADEGKALQDKNKELERAMVQRGEEISALLREHDNCKNGASIQATALTAEVDNLRLEFDALQDQKSKLELHNERIQKEYSENLAKMESLNAKLESRVADHEETIKKLTKTIEQISAENKQVKIWSNRLKGHKQLTEKKMEELADEFRRKMEGNIRLLHQRIHVAEQLNNENKDSYKMTKQRFEQENKMLGEKLASYEDELRTLKVKGTPSQIEADINGLELAAQNGLSLAAGKVEEQREYVLGLVSKMLGEVQFAKVWIRERNGEMKQLKDKVDSLTLLLGDKEEQELMLREKVWKLEANVSKEGGEKLNLIKAVSQLERKVGKLEKTLKERDEELVGLGEKKREAIRQLCFLIEFHRDRCVHLMDLMSKRRVSNRK
ncbi:COP1-interactive protein 1-like [Abrus precatorius]|uniref:COP1-interactive protein 1-like n=1 Tax=Abrus precatorius TaxID=3816 RepID=A0A8B8M1N3_ABRPR|nr:COP1-interactive protein 1-like [Abrus precatorius]